MDARVVQNHMSTNLTQPRIIVSVLNGGYLAALLLVLLSGCQGKSLVSNNPVFSDLPPRRSLVNDATKERTDENRGSMMQVSLSKDSEPLTGNSVVAEVNGRPLFVDDLIGSIRLTIEADERYTVAQRRQILLQQLKTRLDQRVDEEIVLHALEGKVPEEQRDALQEHIGRGV